MSPFTLSGAELVVHVFVAVDDERADAAYAWLCALWVAAKEELRLTGDPGPPTDRAAARSQRDSLLAFAERDDGAVAQAMIRRSHDVVLLSVADDPRDTTSWRTLDERWDAVVTTAEKQAARPAVGVLGSARIYQGGLAGLGPRTALSDCAQAVDDLVPSSRPEPPWDDAGCRTGDGLVAWDTGNTWYAEPPDNALHRRLVVLHPPGANRTLSAWTWAHGANGTTPLTRYLLHTAKLRYSRAVLDARLDDVRRAYRHVNGETATVLGALAAVDLTRPVDDQLDDLLARCTRISLALAALDNHRREFRTLRRTAEIAVANRLPNIPAGLPPGAHLFDDDRIAAEVFLARLDDELEYLDAAREAGRDVNATVRAAADRAAARLESDRRAQQERFGLLQTAVIGVLVMVLTAVQSLQYHVPLDQRVHPGVIALLGALALLLGVEMFGRAHPDGARMRWARAVSAGLCGAAAGWMIETLVRVQLLGLIPDALVSSLCAAVGFVVTVAGLVGARRLAGAARSDPRGG